MNFIELYGYESEKYVIDRVNEMRGSELDLSFNLSEECKFIKEHILDGKQYDPCRLKKIFPYARNSFFFYDIFKRPENSEVNGIIEERILKQDSIKEKVTNKDFTHLSVSVALTESGKVIFIMILMDMNMDFVNSVIDRVNADKRDNDNNSRDTVALLNTFRKDLGLPLYEFDETISTEIRQKVHGSKDLIHISESHNGKCCVVDMSFNKSKFKSMIFDPNALVVLMNHWNRISFHSNWHCINVIVIGVDNLSCDNIQYSTLYGTLNPKENIDFVAISSQDIDVSIHTIDDTQRYSSPKRSVDVGQMHGSGMNRSKYSSYRPNDKQPNRKASNQDKHSMTSPGYKQAENKESDRNKYSSYRPDDKQEEKKESDRNKYSLYRPDDKQAENKESDRNKYSLYRPDDKQAEKKESDRNKYSLYRPDDKQEENKESGHNKYSLYRPDDKQIGKEE